MSRRGYYHNPSSRVPQRVLLSIKIFHLENPFVPPLVEGVGHGFLKAIELNF